MNYSSFKCIRPENDDDDDLIDERVSFCVVFFVGGGVLFRICTTRERKLAVASVKSIFPPHSLRLFKDFDVKRRNLEMNNIFCS